MKNLSLSTAQFSSIFTAPMLLSIFLSIIAGMISDRFGPKRVTTIAFIIACIGLITRIWANSYTTMFLSMLLSGVISLFINTNASKMIGSWFSIKEVGIMMGVFALCGQLPGAFATATTAILFDSMQSAFIVAAVFCVIVFVLWVVFIKDKPEEKMPSVDTADVTKENRSMLSYLKVAAKNRSIWLIGGCIMMALGTNVTLASFLPTAVVSMYGVDMTIVGTIGSMITLGNCVGAILGPVLFKKIRKIRIFVPIMAGLSFLSVLTCWRFASVGILYTLCLAAGIFLGATIPVYLTAPIYIDGIGTTYAASATGIIATMQLLGAVVIPTYVLAPIAGDNFAMMFSLSSVSLIVMGVLGAMIPEFGQNAVEN